MSDRSVGKRVLGHSLTGAPWYEDPILGIEWMEGETVVPRHPHPQAGKRVPLVALDEEMTHQWYKTYMPPVIGDDDEDNV